MQTLQNIFVVVMAFHFIVSWNSNTDGSASYETVKLFPYKQSDSITLCVKGLISEQDRLILYGEVLVNDDTKFGLLVFTIQRSQRKVFQLCIVYLHLCNSYIDRKCYCLRKNSKRILIVLNTTAEVALSEQQVYLYLRTSNMKVKKPSIKLPFISDEFLCTSTINITSETFTAAYKPVVIAKPQEVCYVTVFQNQGVNITCNINNVYPKAKCEVNFDRNTYTTESSVSYNHELITESPPSFNTTCIIFLNHSDISDGINNVTIIIYPYVDEVHETLRYTVQEFVVFTKAVFKDSFCRSASSFEINITCDSNVTYPEAVCYFDILRNLNSTVKGYEAYTHTTQIHGYFTTRCSLFLPYTELESGLYLINVTMHPNITENILILNHHFLFWSLEYKLDKPQLMLENCSQKAREGQRIICKCKGNVDIFDRESFQWYSSSYDLLAYGSYIVVYAFGETKEYICQAYDIKYKKLFKISYILTISKY
uniref:Ig-like domain-containing protein n=1 Tax=Biomphalaria glabrata TaxID=6526 RepID=A0A2C9LYJ3_BIOGL